MKKATKILIVVVFIHIVVFSGLSILLYKNIGYGLINGGDFAIINQILWSTVHGRFFKGTTDSFEFATLGSHSYLAAHFEPIYLFILPFYALLPTTETLIFIKSLFLGLAAIPLYLIAKDKLGGKAALVISFAYLLSPVVALQMFYNIQAEIYAIFFIPLAFYFFQKERFKLFIVSILLLALIKESMPLYIFLFGLYALIKGRPLKWSMPLMVGSIIYFIAVVYFIMPFLGGYAMTNPAHMRATKVLSAFSIAGIYGMIKQTFSASLFGSLILYLLPFGLIFPFLSSVAIFMIPEIFVKLGILGAEYGIKHYSVVLNILIFISLIYFLKNLTVYCSKRIGEEKAQKLLIYICIVLFISMAFRSKGFLNPYYYKPKPYYQAQRQAIKFIPPDASVTAPNLMSPYLSNRFQLDLLGSSTSKYNDLYRGYDYLIIDTHRENFRCSELKRTKELLQILPRRPDYKLVFDKDGILIYKKIKEN